MHDEPMTRTVIPAQPGWHLVSLSPTGGTPFIRETPIIAWAIERYAAWRLENPDFHLVAPVILDPTITMRDPWFARDPTGAHHYFDGGTYPDIEAAIEGSVERGDLDQRPRKTGT